MDPSQLEARLKESHTESFGWALACCGHDRTEAEDVLQTAYLKVLDGRARFGERSAFRTWLFAVIRRTAGEQRRRAALGRLARLRLSEQSRARSAADPQVTIERAETNAQLLAALADLPRRQQQVLHLVFYQDLSIREAGEVLGISTGSARVHYERGKRRLRVRLGEESEA